MMAPVLDELSGELGDKLKIAKVNVDDPNNQELAQKYGVQGIPNLKLFKSGQEIKEFVGFRPKDALAEELKKEI